jgi:hypothetical protein
MTSTSARTLTALLAGALTATAFTAPAAFAKGGGDTKVVARGACATGAWKLAGKPDDGALEVEYELDTNRVGQAWTVTITDNGATVLRTTVTTKAPSGSFSLERRTANRVGTDRISVVATRGATSCRGSIAV